MRKKVTVLFPVYKEKIEMIELALDSILNQTMKDFILRIRLDDPDNLEAEEYLRRKKNEDNRIEFEVNSQNFGLPKTLNLMMDDIETKYVARMDADDISLKNRLEEQYQFMESHHDVDLCGTNIVFIDSNGNGKKYNKIIPTEHKYISAYLKYNNCMAHPTYFMKREVVEKIKYKNELRYAQDYEYICRCIEFGFQIANLDKYLLYYRKSNMMPAKILRQNLIAYYVRYYYRRKEISSNPPIAKKVEQYILAHDEDVLLESISLKKSLRSLFISNKPINKRFRACIPSRYRVDLFLGNIALTFIKKNMK